MWKRAWGWADVSRQVPADPDGVYHIGSLTKVFTAVLLMHFVERGTFGLDDNVDPYVPELDHLPDRPANTTITFRQLASHAAGLATRPDVPDPFRRVDDDDGTGCCSSSFAETPVLGSPGEKGQICWLSLLRRAGDGSIQRSP